MANRPKKKGGLLGKLLKKSQRVTMTKAGQKQAPMQKGTKKAAKKKQPVKHVKSGKEKQAQELKTLATIGKRDPERLAAIISKMLQAAFEEEEDAKLKFERLIWDKAEKRKPPPGEEG